MNITEVLPRTLDAVDVAADRDRARAWLRRRYESPAARWVRINLVSSLTGAAAGADGTSGSLTGGADRLILGVIRAAADVVVVGARSVRDEAYVRPKTARLAILTRTGELGAADLAGPEGADRAPVILLCPADRVDAVTARTNGAHYVIGLEGADPSPRQVVEALAAEGLTRVVCEGGPSVATAFSAAGVVDEYCISVAPALTPARPSILDVSTSPSTHVAGMLVDSDGFSYLRLAARGLDRARAATA